VSTQEYWHEWDLNRTNNAISLSGFTDSVKNWIWEKKRNKGGFGVEFSKPIKRVVKRG
jgi:hypothetical protein